MKSFRAKVKANCSECRDALVSDCKAFGLPQPTEQVTLIPERWISHRCPHMPDGLVLEFETEVANTSIEAGADASGESARWKGEEEIEAPEWRTNLDATKGMGYPARESGKYGSHPSHDGFDDESSS